MNKIKRIREYELKDKILAALTPFAKYVVNSERNRIQACFSEKINGEYKTEMILLDEFKIPFNKVDNFIDFMKEKLQNRIYKTLYYHFVPSYTHNIPDTLKIYLSFSDIC